MDLSKVEAGKLELEISDVNLKLLLENSLVMVKKKALKHGIRLATELDGIPETVRADERKLKQILYNLLSNALKFTPDGGEVCLTGRMVESIFDPFEQVENSASRRYQGTGLGLSLTKSLVELHGGRIRVQSEGESKGSTFSFVLPIHYPSCR